MKKRQLTLVTTCLVSLAAMSAYAQEQKASVEVHPEVLEVIKHTPTYRPEGGVTGEMDKTVSEVTKGSSSKGIFHWFSKKSTESKEDAPRSTHTPNEAPDDYVIEGKEPKPKEPVKKPEQKEQKNLWNIFKKIRNKDESKAVNSEADIETYEDTTSELKKDHVEMVVDADAPTPVIKRVSEADVQVIKAKKEKPHDTKKALKTLKIPSIFKGDEETFEVVEQNKSTDNAALEPKQADSEVIWPKEIPSTLDLIVPEPTLRPKTSPTVSNTEATYEKPAVERVVNEVPMKAPVDAPALQEQQEAKKNKEISMPAPVEVIPDIVAQDSKQVIQAIEEPSLDIKEGLADIVSDEAKEQVSSLQESAEFTEEVVVIEDGQTSLVADVANDTEVINTADETAALDDTDDLFSIEYTVGDHEVSAGDKEALKLFVQRKGMDKQYKITSYASNISGQTNSARRVALQRAIAVRSYLISLGMKSINITVQAVGEQASNGTLLDQVDITIVPQS